MADLRAAALQALEALWFANSLHRVGNKTIEKAIDSLQAALEQPEQEPVEIKPPNPEGATQCIVRWCAETPAGWVGAWDREALEQFVHPPRRSWQGLSEEEIEDLRDDRYFRFARAIEAALKEKNND